MLAFSPDQYLNATKLACPRTALGDLLAAAQGAERMSFL